MAEFITSSRLPQRDYVCARKQRIKIIGPRLHHLPAFFQLLGTVVDWLHVFSLVGIGSAFSIMRPFDRRRTV